MSTLLVAFSLVSSSFAAATSPTDSVSGGQEVSVGQVVSVAVGEDTVFVTERRGGVLQASAVHVRAPGSLASLQPGDTVIVYRESAGDLVVAAR